MDAIAQAVADGALHVAELHRFPLRDADRAHAEMESGRLGGRIVLGSVRLVRNARLSDLFYLKIPSC